MGRGRAKAKQVKVARQLKYSGGGTDLDRLRAELGVGTDRQDDDGHSAYGDLNDHDLADDEDSADEDDLDDEEDDEEDADGYAGDSLLSMPGSGSATSRTG
jgi:Protein of unknown function (DUF3073)